MLHRVLTITFILLVLSIAISASAASKKKSSQSDMQKQMEMMEQMEMMDKMELQDHLDAAQKCARNNDFSCAESRIAKADKLASDNKDKQAVASARSSVQNERNRYDNEVRVAAENRRREEAARNLRDERTAMARRVAKWGGKVY